MAQLYEPDGTPSTVETVEYCIEWCKTHPGWTWGYI